ncbi:MAG: hypothetical protein JW755_14525, partial [Candidatus Aminicenantes bacterium]|nr:hypothetical protein [Candidatus Aminicenantes bacterium]
TKLLRSNIEYVVISRKSRDGKVFFINCFLALIALGFKNIHFLSNPDGQIELALASQHAAVSLDACD